MAGDDFKMQPPARGRGVPARTWQAMLAAQRLVKNRAHDTEADLSVTFPSTGIIYIRNDSGGARSQFDVLGLDVPLVLPSANLGEFQRRVTFSGVMPDTTSLGRFCVLQEALPAGDIGRALVSGVTVGRLFVSPGEEGYGCADAIPGLAAYLQPVPGDDNSGTQILWKEAGAGVVNAIFRVGSTCAPFMLPSSGSGSGTGTCCTSDMPSAVCLSLTIPAAGLTALEFTIPGAAFSPGAYDSSERVAYATAPDGQVWDCLVVLSCATIGGVSKWIMSGVVGKVPPCEVSGCTFQFHYLPPTLDTTLTPPTWTCPSNPDGSDLLVTWSQLGVNDPYTGATSLGSAVATGGACAAGSGSGSGGSNCCAGACTGDLSATITGATGCYTGLPALLSLHCINAGGDIHYWFYESPSVCGGLLLTVSCVHPDGSTGSPMLYVQRGTTSIAYAPQAGWTCSPFSAVYDVDDGAGDTMTVTVT